MIGALYNGILGLTSEQKALDNESNNIANVNTVGYKSSRTSFSDLYYQSGVGMGSLGDDPTKIHNQGTLKQTESEYDFAINGDGFFEVQDGNSLNPVTYYTRAGDFRRGGDGYLTNSKGMDVLGVNSVVSGDKISSDFTNFVANGTTSTNTTVETVNIYTTDLSTTVSDSGSTGSNLKSAQSTLNDFDLLSNAYINALTVNSTNPTAGDIASKQSDTINFGTDLGSDGKYDLSIKIDGVVYSQSYDSSVENTLNKLSDQISSISGLTSSVDATTGDITIDSMVSGKSILITDFTTNGNTVAKTNNSAATGSGQALVDALYNDLKTIVENNGGQIATNKSTITKATSNTVPNSSKIQLDLSVLGMNENGLGDLEFGDDGVVYMRDGDAKYAIAQLTTVSFTSNSGLDPKGDNLYAKTTDSGEPLYIEGKADVNNKSLELSSEDLSKGLVNLIVFQRAYEANSKSVTTADEFLQTAIQMKK